MSRRKPTPDELICKPGRCACGAKIVRGLDDTQQLVTVNVSGVGAAAELIAWTTQRASFVLDLAEPMGRGLTLKRRTQRDLRRHPSGFNRNKIVLEHKCREATT